MANKKIVILGGGTFNYVRCHLALAAPAFGGTAETLASMASYKFDNMDVKLILTKMADHNSSIVTNDDVDKLVDELIADESVKVIIFNVAMCDFTGQIDGVESGKLAKRLKTSSGNVVMNLTPAEKVLGKIRRKRKDIFVVGFKTTCNDTEENMFQAGLNLLQKNSCNLVLCNDVGTYTNFIITPEEDKFKSNRQEVLYDLIDMIHKLTREV